MGRAIRAGKKRFAGNAHYRPDLVPQFYVARSGDKRDDSAIIERIIAAYQKAKLQQQAAGEAFNVSNEWKPIYEHHLGPVMKALSLGNVSEVQKTYQNFFRDPCSTGLVGLPFNIPNLFTGGKIQQKYRDYIMCDVLHRYELWRKRTHSKFTVTALSTPDVGNPFGYIIDGVFVRAGSDYHHCYSETIGALLASRESQVVLELGGGFGGFAFYLLRDRPQVTYLDFDLPEAIALASYYLIKSLPQARIRLFGEFELSQTELQTPGILLMPSFEILKMPPKSVSVSFNSYSLAEMSPGTVRVYLDEIARITSGHFLHVNHNRDAVLGADNFGVEERGFELLTRDLAGWTLGINTESDEYEYLYRAHDDK
jgi:putative sugar O-methyltransferase